MILELLDVKNSDSRLKTVIEIFLATKAAKTLTDNKKQQRDELHKLIMGPGNSYIWFLAWLISWFLEQKNKQRKNKRQMYENCTLPHLLHWNLPDSGGLKSWNVLV